MTRNAIGVGLWLALTVLGFAPPTLAQPAPGESNLAKYRIPELLQEMVPGAERHGEIGGEVPAAAVYKDGEIVGYLYETYDVVQGVGFSRKPFHIIAFTDLTGHVRAVHLSHMVEPIAIMGRTPDDFVQFLQQLRGVDLRKGVSVVIAMSEAVLEGEKFAQRTTAAAIKDVRQIDAVSRTTTSSVLMSDAVVRAGRRVLRANGIRLESATTKRVVEVDNFERADFPSLVADGAVGHLHLTNGDVAARFGESNQPPPSELAVAPPGDPFIDLYVALVSAAGIGVNIMDQTWYDQYSAARGVDDHVLLVMANGPFSFRGPDFEQNDVFKRIRIVQGERTLTLTKDHHKTLPFLHAKGGPEAKEIELFFLPAGMGFDPIAPWQFELEVPGANNQGAARFALSYILPEKYTREAPLPAPPAAAASTIANSADSDADWRSVWLNNITKIWILLATFALLVVILTLQDPIARRPRLHEFVRIAFLAWTLFWVGWIAGAQLTIINLLTYAQSAVEDFRLDFFMMDPLIFLLSGFVLIGLFLWGRAIFCGWLCPFGALQELLNKAARALRIPQINLPHGVHERLSAIKYLIFLGLLGATFYSFDLAMVGTQVEPFKTAITFRFDAPWPAVTYAAGLLFVGLFIERFYCRFVCPLGAGLAILGRVRMFNWLKRRPQCGSQCRICESVCPVGAIKRNGEIDMNECFYCLDCQVTYHDAHTCPPLIDRRKRAEKREHESKGPKPQKQPISFPQPAE